LIEAFGKRGADRDRHVNPLTAADGLIRINFFGPIKRRERPAACGVPAFGDTLIFIKDGTCGAALLFG
jgi:hypothetical protein